MPLAILVKIINVFLADYYLLDGLWVMALLSIERVKRLGLTGQQLTEKVGEPRHLSGVSLGYSVWKVSQEELEWDKIKSYTSATGQLVTDITIDLSNLLVISSLSFAHWTVGDRLAFVISLFTCHHIAGAACTNELALFTRRIFFSHPTPVLRAFMRPSLGIVGHPQT